MQLAPKFRMTSAAGDSSRDEWTRARWEGFVGCVSWTVASRMEGEEEEEEEEVEVVSAVAHFVRDALFDVNVVKEILKFDESWSALLPATGRRVIVPFGANGRFCIGDILEERGEVLHSREFRIKLDNKRDDGSWYHERELLAQAYAVPPQASMQLHKDDQVFYGDAVQGPQGVRFEATLRPVTMTSSEPEETRGGWRVGWTQPGFVRFGSAPSQSARSALVQRHCIVKAVKLSEVVRKLAENS